MSNPSEPPPADPNRPAAAASRGVAPHIHMDWVNLLFLHWRVPAAAMRPLVPAELELDLFDGAAWIALVPFRMENTRFRGVPPVPGLSDFFECNVRTYVRCRGLPGVWFFSLDAGRLVPVLGARWFWNLNYVHSRFEVETGEDGCRTDYRLARRRGPWPPGRSRVVWRVGEPMPISEPGSLEYFLTERSWLFTRRRGRILAGEVRHGPWPLHTAGVEHLEDTVVAASGVVPEGRPIAWYSPRVSVRGWWLRDPGEVVGAVE